MNLSLYLGGEGDGTDHNLKCHSSHSLRITPRRTQREKGGGENQGVGQKKAEFVGRLKPRRYMHEIPMTEATEKLRKRINWAISQWGEGRTLVLRKFSGGR